MRERERERESNLKITKTLLKENGDFRSQECIELLKQSDIVVTNPPFSLFREYIAQLIEYNKKFLIIGNINASSYKEIFKLIKNNEIWWGISTNGSNRWFSVPNNYETKNNAKTKIENGQKYIFVNGIMWYTNLNHKIRNQDLILWSKYEKEKYLKYDNYDAINVDKVSEIPMNYKEKMGVPISFLNKYNPNQFEIIGQMATTKKDEYNHGYPYINGKKKFARIIIKRRENV